METITAVGSLESLRDLLDHDQLPVLRSGSDVVVLPTAAAFTSAEEAAIELASLLEAYGAKVEGLMNVSRASSDEPYFAQRLRAADVVVLSEGSALHARSVWHDALVGEGIRDARNVVAIGSVASVLGDVMIDPRGGAPTNGLGFFTGLVIATQASEDQLARTRSLLGDDVTLAVLGPLGAVTFDGARWRALTPDVVTTRGVELAEL
jgi:hypothetical protein